MRKIIVVIMLSLFLWQQVSWPQQTENHTPEVCNGLRPLAAGEEIKKPQIMQAKPALRANLNLSPQKNNLVPRTVEQLLELIDRNSDNIFFEPTVDPELTVNDKFIELMVPLGEGFGKPTYSWDRLAGQIDEVAQHVIENKIKLSGGLSTVPQDDCFEWVYPVVYSIQGGWRSLVRLALTFYEVGTDWGVNSVFASHNASPESFFRTFSEEEVVELKKTVLARLQEIVVESIALSRTHHRFEVIIKREFLVLIARFGLQPAKNLAKTYLEQYRRGAIDLWRPATHSAQDHQRMRQLYLEKIRLRPNKNGLPPNDQSMEVLMNFLPYYAARAYGEYLKSTTAMNERRRDGPEIIMDEADLAHHLVTYKFEEMDAMVRGAVDVIIWGREIDFLKVRLIELQEFVAHSATNPLFEDPDVRSKFEEYIKIFTDQLSEAGAKESDQSLLASGDNISGAMQEIRASTISSMPDPGEVGQVEAASSILRPLAAWEKNIGAVGDRALRR